MYKEVDAYGVVGDLHTVALAGKGGSIDFMCWPNFDSPSIFAALLDDAQGGRFCIAPSWEKGTSRQIYLPDTNVLFTRFLSPDGVGEICDFMPVTEGRSNMLVRRVKTVRGRIRYRLWCDPKFNYGLSAHTVICRDGGAVFQSEQQEAQDFFLRSPVPLNREQGAVSAEFELKAGEQMSFVLQGAAAAGDGAGEAHFDELLARTIDFWRRWISRSGYQGRWREMVNRSALTLKLLSSKRYGSMVASPTFGLPEIIGGPRNWDYRYTWIRDTCLTLNVLMRLGYTEEAAGFMRWMESRCTALQQDEPLKIMYRIDGREAPEEMTLSGWEGYKGSRPIHVGNAAAGQVQLDIYGELMQAVYSYNRNGMPISYDFWNHLVRLMEWLAKHWQRPDKGIWEIRGKEQEFLYSRVMSWVAFDRAVKLAVERSFPAPLERWIAVRDRINGEIFEGFWNKDRRSFVQYKHARALDASALMMPLCGFIGPNDPLWLSTLQAIEHDLLDDSHVRRYKVAEAADDGVPGEEGTFCMCTFWYVECLSRAGRLDEARFIFEKMLGYASGLGLYSEQLGPQGESIGNFPQAFTHLSLINAAFDLNDRLDRAGKD